MTVEKLHFLQYKFPELLKTLTGNETGEWGKMNPQQMVEHMTDSIRIADGRNPHALHTPAEKLEAMKGFMMSEKEFKPNTKNVLMAEAPPATTNPGLSEAIKELEEEIEYFIAFFKNEPGKTTTNPFFGVLNFEEWIQLLHKHSVHHAKQFRLM